MTMEMLPEPFQRLFFDAVMWEPIDNMQDAAHAFNDDKVSNPGKRRPATWWQRMYAVIICTFVASTGLFHGYDNGVVNGVFTMSSFREMMGWPDQESASVAFWEGLTVNGFNIGAAIAAVLAGHLLVDKHGRRPALLVGSLLFALGGGVQGSAQNKSMLILGRVIAGVGVGITSSAGPAFISEVAPEKIRGMLVGIYQNNVCLAIVAAAVLNYGVHDSGFGWRLSLGLQVAMGLLVVLGLFFVCETPRFLESAGRSSDALKVLTRLRAGDREAAQHELKEVQKELETERDAGDATWSEVFTTPFFRHVVIIGCAIQFFQIMTGINAIVSFSGTLFKALGLRGITFSVIPFVAFAAGNAVGSFALVDRVGRRPLLLWGMVSMCAAMLFGGAVALLVQDPSSGHIDKFAGFTIVSMIVLYMFSFGISWGFGAWLYISEIMPLRVRGKAVGLCTAMNWGPANVLSAFLTPQMISSPLGPGGTLIFFGCVCLAVIPFVATCVPETKGKTLEEIVAQFCKPATQPKSPSIRTHLSPNPSRSPEQAEPAQEIVPLFRFSGWRGFRTFARGNLRGGLGCACLQPSAETDSTEVSSSEGY